MIQCGSAGADPAPAAPARAPDRKEKMEVFRTNVAILKAAAAAGKDWRAQLRDSLKKWEPEFEAIVKKKRRIGSGDTTSMTTAMQVDPDLL